MSKKLEQDILNLLKENARLGNRDIADCLGTSESDVHTIIQKLEKNGTILKYTAIINEAKPEKELIRALIEISVRPEKKSGYDAIAKRISNHPSVVGHYLISGNYDFLVLVEGETFQDISGLVSELASIENVRSTGTHFILKKYKENGVPFVSDELENRLPIIP